MAAGCYDIYCILSARNYIVTDKYY